MTTELQARATRAGITLPWQRYAVGLSWFLLTDRGRHLINHSGGDLGFRSDLYLVPAESLAVVVMANDQTADVGKLARTILNLVAPPRR
jgi:CubicO group peptidase (beta-lactamase class C family)